MNIDPLRPYIGLAKVLGGLALVIVLLGGGCSWGKSIEREKASTTISTLRQQLRDAAAALGGAATALHAVNVETAQALARAEEQQRQADFAEERAKMARADFERQKTKHERELAEAMRDPGCRAELEKPVCAALY